MNQESMTEDSNISRSLNFIRHKIVFLGETAVGKTSIINRFIFDNFQEQDHPTVGIDFISKTLHVDDKQIKFQLWDTAGQERFRSLIPNYIRDSAVAFLVYDISKMQTFENLQNWYNDVRQQRGNDVIIVVVGNKNDLVDQREVSQAQAEEKANSWGVSFLEVSAKSGENVQKLFNMVATSLMLTDTNSAMLNPTDNKTQSGGQQQSQKAQNVQLNQQNINNQNNQQTDQQQQQKKNSCC